MANKFYELNNHTPLKDPCLERFYGVRVYNADEEGGKTGRKILFEDERTPKDLAKKLVRLHAEFLDLNQMGNQDTFSTIPAPVISSSKSALISPVSPSELLEFYREFRESIITKNQQRITFKK